MVEEKMKTEKVKLLFISNVAKSISNFSYPSYLACKEMGFDFHLAANLSDFTHNRNDVEVNLHHIPFYRNPFNIKNIRAFKELNKLMKHENFDFVHCNTPIGGLAGRLLSQRNSVKKVLYTAHGFHFYKKAPIIKKLVFKFAEKFLAKYTDGLITMNEEDYNSAKSFKLKGDKKLYFIKGVGIDTDSFRNIKVDRMKLRSELGLTDANIVLISMGDLIKRKNYETAIKSIANLKNDNVHYIICGRGSEFGRLSKLTKKLNIQSKVHFLGFRNDVKELLKISDIFFFTSLQEGLPRSTMEAMSSGLPCVVSKIRGNTDLIKNGINGFLYNPRDYVGFSNGLKTLLEESNLIEKMSIQNLNTSMDYDLSLIHI